MTNSDSYANKWSLAVFASRENVEALSRTADALFKTLKQPTTVDFLINGNKNLERDFESWLRANSNKLSAGSKARIWSIGHANKAHAWNQYVHFIWPGSDIAFFLDGYVILNEDILEIADHSLITNADALCATGHPLTGRSAKSLRKTQQEQGGFHGNFFGLKQDVMDQFRSRDIKLPIGLYGFDTVLGGFLGYGLHPENNKWDMKGRVISPENITWQLKEKKWWRINDIKVQLKRILNNAERLLVQKATIYFLTEKKMPLDRLQRNIRSYILEWSSANTTQSRKLIYSNPLCFLAYRKFNRYINPIASELTQTLVFTTQSLTSNQRN